MSDAKELAELRREFEKQGGGKVAVTGGFDNSPLPEGKHTAVVTVCKLTHGKNQEGVKFSKLEMHLKIEGGTADGRYAFPYKPDLRDADRNRGIGAAAMNLRRILGDEVPGDQGPDGGLVIDAGEFVAVVPDLCHKAVGEYVEITVKNQKPRADGSHLRKDGTPWQNVYINRGLGDDAAAMSKIKEGKTSDSSIPKGVGGKKPPAKKKVAKKKVVKKKP